MRELISTWGPYLKDFYEYKRLSGFKYNSAESVIYQFDRYYKSLGINWFQSQGQNDDRE